MKPFKRIPYVNGAADEDISIHLNARVGPAKRLPSTNPPRHPRPSLLDSDSDDESTEKARFNQAFLAYASSLGKLSPSLDGVNAVRHSLGPQIDPVSTSEIRNHVDSDIPPHSTSIFNGLSSSPPNRAKPEYTQNSAGPNRVSAGLVSLDENDLSYEFADSDTCTGTDSDFDRYSKDVDSCSKDNDHIVDSYGGDDNRSIESYSQDLDDSLNDTLSRKLSRQQSPRQDPNISNIPRRQIPPSHYTQRPRRRLSAFFKTFLVFMASFVLALLVFFHYKGLSWNLASDRKPPSNHTPEIAALVSRLEGDMKRLSSAVDSKIQAVSDKLLHLETSQISSSLLLAILHREFATLKTAHGLCDTGSDLPCISLSDLSQKLERIQHLSNDADLLKADLLESLVELLPLAIPVYLEDGKVMFTPQFYDHLHTYLGAYMESSITAPHTPLDSVLALDLLYVTRAQFKALLASKLDSKNTDAPKINNGLVERHLEDPLPNTQDFDRDSNRIYVENLIASDGSQPMNYALYDTGARILGFLTSCDTSKSHGRLILGRILWGWYDCLLSPPKHQANDMLTPSNETWTCHAAGCSIGINLSKPVVVYEILIHHSLTMSPDAQVYMRPINRKSAQKLKRHLDNILIHQPSPLPTRYLTLFLLTKVQRNAQVQTPTTRTTIRLSPSVVNLGVLSRDIFIGLSPKHSMQISHIEIFATHDLIPNRHIPTENPSKPTNNLSPDISLGDDQAYPA